MIKLMMKYKNYVQLLNLDSKITVITGDSASGKSSIGKLSNLKGSSFVDIKINDPKFELLYIENDARINATEFKENWIYVIDEGVTITSDRADRIKRSKNCYFIIITRNIGSLGNLNYDLYSVKKLIEVQKGRIVLQNLLYDTNYSDDTILNSKDYVIVEDSKRAYEWFSRMFSKLNVNIVVAGESLISADSKDIPGGKEKVCKEAKNRLESGARIVLLIFDRCSFGSQLLGLKALLDNDEYYKRIRILSDYVSWEYLMLKTNMFKKYFKPYNISIDTYEEEYYELQLEDVSRKYGVYTIKHDPKGNKAAKLAKCYYEKCCCVNRDSECHIGISGDDKYKVLLIGTEFERILNLSGR